MIGIRADGNQTLGLGHIMRCLTIAKELVEQQQEVCFFIADSSCEDIIRQNGFEAVVLNTDYRDMDSELPSLTSLLKRRSCTTLLVDSYQVTAPYLKCLNDECYVFYMDDLASFAYPVNAIINYNISACESVYRLCNVAPDVKLYLGSSYAPVRKEFRVPFSGSPEEIHNVFITLGGSDCYDLALKIVSAASKVYPQLNYHVICGPFYANPNLLFDLSAKNPNVLVYKNVSNMAEIMSKCDCAISAGGSTMYELSSMGIPTITFSYVDNQKEIARVYGQREAALYAGHYSPSTESAFLYQVMNQLHLFLTDLSLLVQCSVNAHNLVDGNGASRLSSAIIHILG